MKGLNRTIIVVAVGLVLIAWKSRAQTTPSQALIAKQQQNIMGGFGLTFIDGQPYYLFNLMPELSFGKIGVGLDLNIRVGKNGKIRSEDFDEGYDYLRIIRYIRYGTKKEPLYARVGVLDYARLGHGTIVYNYRNSASYDERKFGMEFDLDFEKFGFESVYSDFGAAGLFGLRTYARPLKFTSLADVPVIGGMEAGITYAADFHEKADVTAPIGPSPRPLALAQDGGSLGIFGFDIGFPVLSMPMVNSTLYTDFASISGYGSGLAVGIDLYFSGLGIVGIGAKYERRWTGDQYMPSYFDALYEKERYVPFDTTGFMSKAQLLKSVTGGEGYYGELLVSILGTFNIIGGYQSPVGVKNAGILHFEFDAGDAIPGIILRAGYDKKNVGRVFKVDNNSLFSVDFGYKPLPFIFVSTTYLWTFTEEKNDAGVVTGYKSQKRIEPKVGFVISF
ncbi:MAG: hypothetical protein HBSIN02_08190 [Bacteroidia bacterium]|nr:MAG: hypothetical protein HBSIN02_08190 [Bacteroidia bacterium]